MTSKIGWAAAAVVVLIGGVRPAWADPYRQMARDLSRAALRHGAHKLAVLPFNSSDGAGAAEGRRAAERLTTQLVRLDRVEAVERGLLEKVLGEQRLMSTGLVARDSAEVVGRLLPVDAVVTGSVFRSEDKVEIHARMIEVGTGKVLAASEARLDAEGAPAHEPAVVVRVPDLDVPVPAFAVEPPDLLRDSLGDLDACDDAEATVRDLESSVVDVHARYWASRMKEPGFSIASLTVNPGSDIADPEVKARFYAALKERYAQPSAQISASEFDRLTRARARARRIVDACSR